MTAVQWVYNFNDYISAGLEKFLESAVPLIAAAAELVGLIIIVISLVKATYHYLRTIIFHDKIDYRHEMSSGLTTALEFLMSAEVAKTFLLPSLESVIPLAATIGLRAMMSLLLHIEMRGSHDEEQEPKGVSAAKAKAKAKAVKEALNAEAGEPE